MLTGLSHLTMLNWAKDGSGTWVTGTHGSDWIYQGGGVPQGFEEQERHDPYLNRLELGDSPVQDSSIHVWAPPYQTDPFSVDTWLAPVTGRHGVY
ncbi:hypothetical protein T484DRAFT_2293485 [Baffinella frigidus]|nr:hypothetical protein T484DRAFT_2293485 [Cryptophyta sp. CCMP2293]